MAGTFAARATWTWETVPSPPASPSRVVFNSKTNGEGSFDTCNTCPDKECELKYTLTYIADPGNLWCLSIDGSTVNSPVSARPITLEATCASAPGDSLEIDVWECTDASNLQYSFTSELSCLCDKLPDDI